MNLPILQGTKASYNALETKQSNAIYILNDVTNENNLFLGTLPIGKGATGKVVKLVEFDDETNVFTFTYTDDTTTTVDLVLESVIKNVDYSQATHKLTLTLVNGSETEIDLSDLVDIYTSGNSDSVAVSIAEGVITANVKISDTAGNAIAVEAGKGLFVNISAKMNLVAGAIENNITAFGIGGQVKDSGKAFVTSIDSAATDNQIPTAAAVKNSLVIGSF